MSDAITVAEAGRHKKWLPADSHEILHQQICSMRPNALKFYDAIISGVIHPILKRKEKNMA